MKQLFIVVENAQAWRPYHPSENVVTAADYLRHGSQSGRPGAQVINLCTDLAYLGEGYYCSLLAEARGHRALPSTRTLYDLANLQHFRLYEQDIDRTLDRYLVALGQPRTEPFEFSLYFGQAGDETLTRAGRRLFDAYPCPILRVTVTWQQQWLISEVQAGSIEALADTEQDLFADAIDRFSRKIWRKPRARKRFRFEMAVLRDPDEAYPPSDARALVRFQRIGRELGIDVDLLTRHDYVRLLEYDALFIRETTALNHHTYRFAKRAESEGLVVVDDPDSIRRCTNKVFLAELLGKYKVPTPATRLLLREERNNLSELVRALGFPLVLKIPDGSFSRGIEKVEDDAELHAAADRLFRDSAILLAQEYVRTDFDWRIGVFGGRPIFACRYFMAKGHWQIYNHATAGRHNSGDFESVGVNKVPKQVLRTAIKSAGLIGDSLYGVDLKQVGDQCLVIEVNDNPNIDHGVEDAYLGDDLYRMVMDEFLRRLERQRQRS